jgi:hypothetical protein
MKNKNKKSFQKQTLGLKDNHTWKALAGYKIVVLDRGAVSFNVPESWLVAKLEPFELHDQEPPDDNARLTVSFWRMMPGIDWSGLPLEPLLLESVKDTELKVLDQGEVVKPPRKDLELVWIQRRFLDPVEKRDAFTRIAMARGFDVHMLMTFDFWVEDVRKFQYVWDEALRSLQLGRVIEDPTRGVITQ